MLLILIWLLGTSGWVLDPLLEPVMKWTLPPDAPARPSLKHLRVRLNHKEGLLVEAGGFALKRPDGREALWVESVRGEWTAEQLWAKHWAVGTLQVGEVRVSVWRGESGGWEWIPLPSEDIEQEEKMGPPPDWYQVESIVKEALPLDGRLMKAEVTSLVLMAPDEPEPELAALGKFGLEVEREGRKVSLLCKSEGGSLGLAGWLREALVVKPWELEFEVDFESGGCRLKPLQIEAGPVALNFRVETGPSEGDGSTQVMYSFSVRPFRATDILEMLEPGVISFADQWMDKTGGWGLREFEFSGQLELDLKNAAEPAVREGQADFRICIEAGKELLALDAGVILRSDPLRAEVKWQVSPLRPANIILPQPLDGVFAAIDFPVSANGTVSLNSLTELDELTFVLKCDSGKLIPSGPLAGILPQVAAMDGAGLSISLSKGMKLLEVNEFFVGLERIRLDGVGLRVELDESPLSRKDMHWQGGGQILVSALSLANVDFALSEELRSEIPLPKKDWDKWGITGLKLDAAFSGTMSSAGVPVLDTAVMQVEPVMKADGLELPVKLKVDVENETNGYGVGFSMALSDLDLGALVSRWPAEVLAEYREQVLGFGVAGWLREFRLHGVLESLNTTEPVKGLKVLDVDLWLEELTAQLPELGLLCIGRIDLSAGLQKGKLDVTGIVPEAFASGLDVRLDWSGQPMQIPSQVNLNITAQPGVVSIPELWSQPFPVDLFSITAQADPLNMKVQNAGFMFAGAGLLFEMDELQARREEERWYVAGALRFGNVDLQSLLVYWPKGMFETEKVQLHTLSPQGRLDDGWMRFAISSDLVGFGPENIESFSFGVNGSEWSATYDNRLYAAIPGFQLEGDLAGVRFTVPEMRAGPLEVKEITLYLSEILEAQPVLHYKWDASMNVADLMDFMEFPEDDLRRSAWLLLGQPEPTIHMEGSVGPGLNSGEWELSAGVRGRFLLPFSTDINAFMLPDTVAPFGGLREIVIESFNLGHTDLSGRVAPLEQGLLDVRLAGNSLRVDEWMQTADPLIQHFLTQSAVPEQVMDTQNDESSEVVEQAAPALAIDVDVKFAAIQLAEESALRDVSLRVFHSRNGLPVFALNATEGTDNRVLLQLDAVEDGAQALHVEVPNIAGFASLCVSPLLGIKLPDTALGNNLDVIRRMPDSFSGGVLNFSGAVAPDNSERMLEGRLHIDEMVMVRAPCLLRAVAAVSGKSFVEGVVFKQFSMEHFRVGSESFEVLDMKMDGPVTMNIQEGFYRFEDQFIRVSGDHYLSNFMLEGSITAPKVWLDNKLTRALGSDDSDWADW